MMLQWLFALWLVCQAAGPASTVHRSDALMWPPPALTDPITIHVEPNSDSRVIRMSANQDYIIDMPDEPVMRGVVLEGGRNIVLISGEIQIPWQGDRASVTSRTGLKILRATGTVHIEGLVIAGDDLSEGIQIDAPRAIVQIQNIGIYGVHARDEANFSDNHPDLIQPYGGMAELRVDGFTGSTDYQGFFFKSGVPFGRIDLRRVNIVGLPTARYLMWFGPDASAGTVTLSDVWVDVPDSRRGGLGKSVWPDVDGSYPGQAQIVDDPSYRAAFWPEAMKPSVFGMVFEGRPPGGDFVNRDQIGIHYVSPGYQ